MRISEWSSDVCSSDLMAPVWDWLRDRVADKADPAFLNLFGYPGVGRQALAAAGAVVTHVDASKKSVAQIGRAAWRQCVGKHVYILAGAVQLKKKQRRLLYTGELSHTKISTSSG